MADARSQLERWVSFAAGIVAPVTVLSGLLFYFGYVSSRSRYEYFGIEVDTIGLSTRDYVLRSPQPLLVPLLVLTLLAVVALLVHLAIRARMAATEQADRTERLGAVIRRTRVAAAAVLIAGVLALLGYALVGDLRYYAIVTPVVIGTGAATLGYALRLGTPARRSPAPATPAPATLAPASPGPATPHRAIAALLAFVTLVCAFWATATTAEYSGRGAAKDDARHPGRFPVVILDTRERLYLRSPSVEETALPTAAGQTFRYRYRRLRLLVVGESRMFLIPETWSASNTTLVVPLDGSVRAQFQFQNDPP